MIDRSNIYRSHNKVSTVCIALHSTFPFPFSFSFSNQKKLSLRRILFFTDTANPHATDRGKQVFIYVYTVVLQYYSYLWSSNAFVNLHCVFPACRNRESCRSHCYRHRAERRAAGAFAVAVVFAESVFRGVSTRSQVLSTILVQNKYYPLYGILYSKHTLIQVLVSYLYSYEFTNTSCEWHEAEHTGARGVDASASRPERRGGVGLRACAQFGARLTPRLAPARLGPHPIRAGTLVRAPRWHVSFVISFRLAPTPALVCHAICSFNSSCRVGFCSFTCLSARYQDTTSQ